MPAGRPGIGVEARENSIRVRFTWNGRRWRETLDLPPTAANLKYAAKLVARIKAEIAYGVFDYERHFPKARVATFNENTPFRQYAERWLETMNVASSTARTYRLYVGIWIRAFGNVPIGSLKHSDVKQAVASRAREVTGKSVNNSLHPLRGIFESAVADELIKESPLRLIKSHKHQRPEPDPFTSSEMADILSYMRENYPEAAWNYFDFAFATGLRPSELIVLKWAAVDWEACAVRVAEAKVDGEVKETKTHRVRSVDLIPAAMAALARQRALSANRRPGDEIFTNPRTDEAWKNDRAQREDYFHPALAALGMRRRDAYQTRHTFATLRLMGGVNPAYIARQLGHSSTAMLFKHYTKWIDGADNGREKAKVTALFE